MVSIVVAQNCPARFEKKWSACVASRFKKSKLTGTVFVASSGTMVIGNPD